MEELSGAHRAGAGGLETAAGIAAAADAVVLDAWETGAAPHRDVRHAVAALGGYGRGEMAPRSDVDLLFLFARERHKRAELIGGILRPLWDLGFDIGHSSRTVGECVAMARDLESCTAMLDARLLAGDEELFADFRKRLLARLPKATVRRLRRLHLERGAHAGSAQLLEPNVKESPGALREIHLLEWAAKAHGRTVDAAAGLGEYLDGQDRHDLAAGRDFLWRVRHELHFSMGRKHDVLENEIKPLVARNLGYLDRAVGAEGELPRQGRLMRVGTPDRTGADRGRELAVEAFLRDYYLHASRVFHVARLGFDRLTAGPRKGKRLLLEPGVVAVDNQIELPEGADWLAADPLRLLSIFRLSQTRRLSLSEPVCRLLRQSLHLIDGEVRRHPGARDLFLRILERRRHTAATVVRVSGPAAGEALARIGGAPLPEPRRAALRRFHQPETGEPIDEGLALWFPAPGSATGEDMAEFHVHGGPAVLDALTHALAALPGLRPAEPGAFTRRAFEAGRLDLTEAEGIADLVAAETEAQRRQALAQMEGGLHRLYDGWRARLMALRAHAEAAVDFSDQDLGEDPMAAAVPDLAALEAEIAAHLDDSRRGERLREGFCIAIVGAPNAGKSSLLNRLAGRDAAIVSTRAGTTRDVVEVRMDLAGWPVTLADTAGLRESRDEIESEGVRRALARAASADLSLVVFDGALWPEADANRALHCWATMRWPCSTRPTCSQTPAPAAIGSHPALGVSCLTGAGIEALLEALADEIARRYPAGGAPALTRARHRHAAVECRDALARALAGPADERLAEELRLAAHALGRITGRVDVEAMLDLVFRDFCIGK